MKKKSAKIKESDRDFREETQEANGSPWCGKAFGSRPSIPWEESDFGTWHKLAQGLQLGQLLHFRVESRLSSENARQAKWLLPDAAERMSTCSGWKKKHLHFVYSRTLEHFSELLWVNNGSQVEVCPAVPIIFLSIYEREQIAGKSCPGRVDTHTYL